MNPANPPPARSELPDRNQLRTDPTPLMVTHDEVVGKNLEPGSTPTDRVVCLARKPKLRVDH
jgi:hypothetical protein